MSAAQMILIVEDEVDTAEILRSALEQRGYQVQLAHDGRQALQMIKDTLPSLIITDIMLPHVDGLEIIARLNNSPQTREIPVIAMSGTERVEHQPFLRKPFLLKDLLAEVERLLPR